MNAGFSNLASLKAWLLPAGLITGSDYDQQIAAIGLGVVGRFERHCNRKFARVEDFVEIFPADRTKHVVQRYPIEAISKIEVQQVKQDGFAELPDLIINQQNDAGLIYFYGQQGWQRGLVRITYTGGFFWETLDSDDDGFPTELPDGATAIEAELLLAWQLQCEHVWTQRDKLGLAIGTDPHASHTRVVPSLALIDLLPDVEKLLNGFIRYQLS